MPIAADSPAEAPRTRTKPKTCVVSEGTLDASVALRLSARGAKLATLVDAAASVALGGRAPRLTLESNGVVLWTPYDAEEHPLHLRRGIAIAGVLTPTPSAAIEWRSDDANSGTIRYQAGAALNHLVAEAEAQCADLGLNQASYEVDIAADGAPKLLVGAAPVSVKPDGPVSLTLPRGDATIACLELERAGSYSRIQANDTDAVLTGWVPVSFLQDDPAPGGFGLRGMGGGGRGYGRVPRDVEFTACEDELPLFLGNVPGQPQAVGLLRAGTRFAEQQRPAADPSFVLVDLWQSWIWPEGEE
ncbi:MAG: hypothetical protein KC492_37325, partial [Myxococcales bacterium]|nr:hypothetical protein [Myxococcales bacterium]